LIPEISQLSFKSILLYKILFAVFEFIVTAAVWLELIKPALQEIKDLTSSNFSLLRFKNNPNVFSSLLRRQRRVNMAPFENDLQLGNPDAKFQIMVACNPYCGPCARTHKILHELVNKTGIGLTIRFAIRTDNTEDKRFKAVKYILQQALGKTTAYKRKLLHDWYVAMNFEKISQQYPLTETKEIDELLMQHEQWTEKAQLKGTPTIFINGYEYPKGYNSQDLNLIIKNIESIIDEKDCAQFKNDYTLA
jgi:hypothetical protein